MCSLVQTVDSAIVLEAILYANIMGNVYAWLYVCEFSLFCLDESSREQENDEKIKKSLIVMWEEVADRAKWRRNNNNKNTPYFT